MNSVVSFSTGSISFEAVIHLEWVTDLTGTQFLSCIRRFVSRRGKPDSIISDNAPQFKLTSTVLSKQWRDVFVDKEVLSYVAAEGIKWNFTTALRSSLAGGLL